MNLLGIEAFLAIVEAQSLSKAAEKLFLTQSTISNRLNVLENQLNTKLVERSQGQRFITLTSEGEEFISIAKRWMALQRDTEFWINKESPFKLSIGSVDSLNSHVFIEIYKKIMQKETSFELNISSHWSNTIFDLLESYEIDIGLVPRLIKTNSLLSKPIFSERLVFISNPNFSNYDDFVHPEYLSVKKEIFLDWGGNFKIWHDSLWDPTDSIEIVVDTTRLIFEFIDRPDAWSIVPESIAHSYKEIQPLKISEFVKPPPERICYKVIHRDPLPKITEPLKIFESYLLKYIENNPFLTKI
ncbi:LysR family transcriptional regulator [Schnuerera sp.]|uniref:LysR family transcriptional regulator n=1 Tax=Schnuerera sp. TaxID=2794844 RepID=UPI002CA45751|nr:LysR family transcriptional regulator [Schnuerera sp.]HSH34847.1 LysR family transcriptional regulator [Schnuerera sp.]